MVGMFLISACNSKHNETLKIGTDGTASEATVDKDRKETNEVLSFPKIEKISFSLPGKIFEYNPEVTVLPLVSSPQYYMDGVLGDLMFVNKNKELISIPDETIFYFPTEPSELDLSHSFNPKALMLFNQDLKGAVMRVDGQVVTDFVYGIIPTGGDNIHIPTYQNYILVCEYGSNERFGVVNIQTGEEIIAPVYLEIYFLENCVYAIEDDNGKKGRRVLFNYWGELLFDFDTNEVNVWEMNLSESGYYLDCENGVLYQIEIEKGISILQWNDCYILKKPYGDRVKTTVFKEDGTLLLNKYSDMVFTEPDALILMDGQQFTAIVQGQNEAICCEYPGDTIEINRVFNANYLPEFDLFYLGYWGNQKNDYFDRNGIRKNFENPNDNEPWEAWEVKIGNVIFNSQGCALIGEDGKAIFPFGQFEYISYIGEFVIASNGRNEEKVKNIYNEKGELLISNVYAIIDELTIENGIVIYKDANICGLLYIDGRFEQINFAPKIEKINNMPGG